MVQNSVRRHREISSDALTWREPCRNLLLERDLSCTYGRVHVCFLSRQMSVGEPEERAGDVHSRSHRPAVTRSSARGCHPKTIMAIMDDPIVGELSALQLPALQVARRISLVISSADSPHKTARFRGHGGGTWPLGDRKSLSKWPLGTLQKHKNPVGDQPRNDRSSRDELGSRQGSAAHVHAALCPDVLRRLPLWAAAARTPRALGASQPLTQRSSRFSSTALCGHLHVVHTNQAGCLSLTQLNSNFPSARPFRSCPVQHRISTNSRSLSTHGTTLLSLVSFSIAFNNHS